MCSRSESERLFKSLSNISVVLFEFLFYGPLLNVLTFDFLIIPLWKASNQKSSIESADQESLEKCTRVSLVKSRWTLESESSQLISQPDTREGHCQIIAINCNELLRGTIEMIENGDH